MKTNFKISKQELNKERKNTEHLRLKRDGSETNLFKDDKGKKTISKRYQV